MCLRNAATMASPSAVRTVERASLGPMASAVVVVRLSHFWMVVGLTPKRRARVLTLSCWIWTARRTAFVVRAHLWRTWPIAPPLQCGGHPYHHTPGIKHLNPSPEAASANIHLYTISSIRSALISCSIDRLIVANTPDEHFCNKGKKFKHQR